MKKTVLRIVSIALLINIVTFTSCQKDETADGITFRAKMEDCTSSDGKTVLNGTHLYWSPGDQIVVFGSRPGKSGIFETRANHSAAWTEFKKNEEVGTGPFDGPYRAFYPHTITTDGIHVDLPSVQMSEDGSLTGFPMYAVTKSDVLQFQNMCGVFKLRLTKPDVNVKSIKITAMTNINGKYRVDYNSHLHFPSLVYTNSGSNSTRLKCRVPQSIDNGKNFYIYLPSGEYSNLKIKIYTDDYRYCEKTAKNTVVINCRRSQTTDIVFDENDLDFVDMPGFAISTTGCVNFALGNLQYQPSTDTWRFAEHQYDFVGEDNVNIITRSSSRDWVISTTGEEWMDLFSWGTGNNPTFLSQDTRHNDYPTFVDWGTNNISNNGCEGWRTLSKDEWYYLFYTRTGASEKCGSGNINGINGIVLLPDNWTLPEGCTFISGMNGWANNNYTLTQWEDMEDEGAIFFPAACMRNYSYNYGGGQGGLINSYIYGVASQQESWNGYWSSTPNNFNMDGWGITAFSLLFNSSDVSACRTGVGYYSGFFPRNMGLSVRLARDIEQE